jgi:hypothetical protein
MRKPEPHFVNAIADTAEKEGNTQSMVEDYLDGAPLGARWEDACYIAMQLLGQFSHGQVMHLERTAVGLLGQGETERVAAVRHALEYAHGGRIDGELGQRELVNLVVSCIEWSRLLARVERVEGGEPLRWVGGKEMPAHWARFALDLS